MKRDVQQETFELFERVTRRKVNAFRYSEGVGTIVAIVADGRYKIKWDTPASTGQQHSTIQGRFLERVFSEK